jgi:glycerate 2-kinase
MNVLIAADSFKDACAGPSVCAAIAKGIARRYPDAQLRLCPLADGGEGTLEVLAQQLDLHPVSVPATDPLQRPIMADYFLSRDQKVAFVEMARTAGIQLLPLAERNPLHTSTLGTGMQIADALRRGVQQIVLAIGSSATNDAGTGMAHALGWRFFDQQGNVLLPTGQQLGAMALFEPPAALPEVEVQVICDVTNPLFGPLGAAYVYARQKGADEAAIEHLDRGLRHFAQITQQQGYAVQPDFPGSGAAGGMGFGSRLFLNAELKSGIDLVLDLIHFEEKLAWADFLITGEGCIDSQTVHGKLIRGLCNRAMAHGIPVVGLCGLLTASEAEIAAIGLDMAFSINEGLPKLPLPELLKATEERLTLAAIQLNL